SRSVNPSPVRGFIGASQKARERFARLFRIGQRGPQARTATPAYGPDSGLVLPMRPSVSADLAYGRPGPEAAAPGPPQPLCLPRQEDGRFTIGRAPSCDFTVADLSVSRWHARLHKQDQTWMLSDLGSTNGTRLNGWRVTKGVQVRPGDQVSFGTVTY